MATNHENEALVRSFTERIDRMHKPDGSLAVEFDFRIMGTFVIRGGRIARYTDYYDSLGGARALGRI